MGCEKTKTVLLELYGCATYIASHRDLSSAQTHREMGSRTHLFHQFSTTYHHGRIITLCDILFLVFVGQYVVLL